MSSPNQFAGKVTFNTQASTAQLDNQSPSLVTERVPLAEVYRRRQEETVERLQQLLAACGHPVH